MPEFVKNHKFLLSIVALHMVVLGVFVFLYVANPTVVSAACCPGEPGCGGGTCFGIRQNPPGGCGCYTNAEGCGSGCPGSPPPQPPPCSKSLPAAATPTTPVNNAVDVDYPITFKWTDGASWGSGCPDSKSYHLYVAERTAASCPASGYTSYYNGGALTANVDGLKWGTSYCWFVQKDNNGQLRNSSVLQFTTTTPPNITNVAIIGATKCDAAPISGRYINTNVNNPITVQMDISDGHNNFATNKNVFVNVKIAVVAQTDQNSAIAAFSALEPILYNRLGYRGVPAISGTATFSAATTAVSPYFGAGSTSGNLAGGSVKSYLLSLNSATSIKPQADNKTMRVTWQLRFEDTFITAADNIYAAVVSTTPGGKQISQDPGLGSTATLNYRKVLTWKTDLQSPAASVTGPTAISPNTFAVNWTANDTATGNNGIKELRSYCFVDSKPTFITDVNLAQNINLDAIPLSYPNPANCLITTGNLGSHTYKLSDQGNQSNIYFKMFTQDGACNVTNASAQLNSPSAWMITSNGSTTVKGGFTNFFIHNVATLAGIVPNLGADAFLSTYSAIAGNGSMVPAQQSKNNFYTTNYEDRSLIPPVISGQTTWFDYLYQQAASRQTFVGIGGNPDISGNISTALGAAAGADVYRYIKGNLTLEPNTNCDVNAAIFVEGTLTIKPDLKKASQYVGCVFVVKGDITADTGTPKSPLVPSTTTPSLYDRIEGGFITDGKLTTTNDQQGSASLLYPGDGLYFHGFIYSADISLNRNLGLSQNGLQPAEAFDYDPYYARVFRALFGVKTFSLRAQ